MSVEVRPFGRDEIARRLDDLAELRITVFRDWPYLYDGDDAYERRYLRPYAESSDAIVVGVFDGSNLVGASTGAPLADHQEAIAQALVGLDLRVEEVFYLAESVLLPEYRGRGFGHAFFDMREAHARQKGYRKAAFASVVRPHDHPSRPSSSRDLGPFWRDRGYAPVAGATAHLSWRDIGDSGETEKALQIWMRDLDAA